MSDFKGYWKNYEDENYVLGSEEYCAQQAWKHQQAKIEKLENELSTTKQVLGNVIDMEVAKVDNLKTQLNNMEACYIEKKQQIDGLHTLILNWRGLKIKGIAPEHRAYEKALGDCADQLEQSMRGVNV